MRRLAMVLVVAMLSVGCGGNGAKPEAKSGILKVEVSEQIRVVTFKVTWEGEKPAEFAPLMPEIRQQMENWLKANPDYEEVQPVERTLNGTHASHPQFEGEYAFLFVRKKQQ